MVILECFRKLILNEEAHPQFWTVNILNIISVADPGCLSRIRLFSVLDPGQKGTGSHIPDADLHTEYNLPWQTSTITVQGKLSVKRVKTVKGDVSRD